MSVKCDCGHEFEPKIEYRHKLLCGDSTAREDVERVMGGEKANMLSNDPPYGMGLDTDYSKMPKTSRGFQAVIGDDKPFDGWHDAIQGRCVFPPFARRFRPVLLSHSSLVRLVSRGMRSPCVRG